MVSVCVRRVGDYQRPRMIFFFKVMRMKGFGININRSYDLLKTALILQDISITVQ